MYTSILTIEDKYLLIPASWTPLGFMKMVRKKEMVINRVFTEERHNNRDFQSFISANEVYKFYLRVETVISRPVILPT